MSLSIKIVDKSPGPSAKTVCGSEFCHSSHPFQIIINNEIILDLWQYHYTSWDQHHTYLQSYESIEGPKFIIIFKDDTFKCKSLQVLKILKEGKFKEGDYIDDLIYLEVDGIIQIENKKNNSLLKDITENLYLLKLINNNSQDNMQKILLSKDVIEIQYLSTSFSIKLNDKDIETIQTFLYELEDFLLSYCKKYLEIMNHLKTLTNGKSIKERDNIERNEIIRLIKLEDYIKMINKKI